MSKQSESEVSTHKQFGSTRKPSLEVGTRVLVTQVRHTPTRVSKKTGEVRIGENKSQIFSGSVVRDSGDTLRVKVKYPSGVTRTLVVQPTDVTLESNWQNGLSNPGV